jgi:hemolysin D
VGQTAVVKIDAFPFTNYGTIDGTVTTVSRDAVDNRDPQNNGGSLAANATRTPAQSLVFPATVVLAQNSIDINGKAIPLSPGMAVTVEIKTQQRRAIDFLISPLSDVVSRAAHER